MQALLDVILPVFLVLGAGYVAVWRGLFSDAGVDALMKFAQGFAIPCLLFKAMAGLDLQAGFNLPLLFSFYFGAVSGFAAGLLAGRFLFGRPWTDSVSIGFSGLFSNSVLLGLPITERAYGAEALAGNFAIIALHAPFCYFLGIIAMEIARGAGAGVVSTARRVVVEMAHNALIIGVVLGLIANVTNLPVPGVVMDGLDLLSRAALPAALFALGGILYRYRPEGDIKVIATVCAISLVLHPAVSFASATLLGLERDAFRSVVVTAAMAPGVNTYLFANMYGAARRVAASSVLLATFLSLGTVWLWLLVIP